MTVKVFTVANLPNETLARLWLLHLREFDLRHGGCHFQVVAEAENMPFPQIVDVLRDLGLSPVVVVPRGTEPTEH